jgi:hypothetical protein
LVDGCNPTWVFPHPLSLGLSASQLVLVYYYFSLGHSLNDRVALKAKQGSAKDSIRCYFASMYSTERIWRPMSNSELRIPWSTHWSAWGKSIYREACTHLQQLACELSALTDHFHTLWFGTGNYSFDAAGDLVICSKGIPAHRQGDGPVWSHGFRGARPPSSDDFYPLHYHHVFVTTSHSLSGL